MGLCDDGIHVGHCSLETGAIEVELGPNGAGWKGAGSIPVAGVWEATAVMKEDLFTETRSTCEVRLAP